MKRRIIPGLIAVLIFVSQAVSAQQAADLPEPVFVEDFD
jgi:hypothetical protein